MGREGLRPVQMIKLADSYEALEGPILAAAKSGKRVQDSRYALDSRELTTLNVMRVGSGEVNGGIWSQLTCCHRY